MELRDLFAGLAMQKLLEKWDNPHSWKQLQEIVEASYTIAALMIAQKNLGEKDSSKND
jgi:hypothetical protein